MEEENEELKYKTVTYILLTFFLLYFIIHVGLSFYPADEAKDPISKEGFWFYVRVFAPMIGAAIGAFASFKAAIYTFTNNKRKDKKKEKKRLNELKQLILTCLIQTNIKLDEATNEVVKISSKISEKINKKEFLLELNHNFDYLPPENLFQIKKEDFYKILIIKQKSDINNIYTYYDYFIQSLSELKRIQEDIDKIFKEINIFFIDFKSRTKDFFENILKENSNPNIRKFVRENQYKYMIQNQWLTFLEENFKNNQIKIIEENKSLFLLHTQFFDSKLNEFQNLLKSLIKIDLLFNIIINNFFEKDEVNEQKKKVSSLNKLIRDNYKEMYETVYHSH